MRSRVGVLAVALGMLVSVGLLAQDVAAPSPSLAAARAAYEGRADAARAAEAVELFRKAATADPASYEARWEGARAVYYLGAFPRAEAADAELVALFDSGIALAKEAVALRPKGVEGHFWLGVLYGVWGEARGILKSLAMVPLIRQEMQTCTELDSSVEGWGPDRLLGRVFFKLPWFKGGDNAKALEHLERSLKGAPTNTLTRVYLAEVLRSEGQKVRAVALLEEAVALAPDPRWVAEQPFIKARAAKLLKKLR
jgi:tetratricopeptide (TPR) repeat protein